jgi:hypothetical protein
MILRVPKMSNHILGFASGVVLCIFQSELESTIAQEVATPARSQTAENVAPHHSAQEWQILRDNLVTALRSIDRNEKLLAAIDRLQESESKKDMEAALAPLTLLRVSINPESRVKLNALRPNITVHGSRPQLFLIEVDNTAGITAPLHLSAIDLATHPPAKADWCKIEIVETPFMSRFFTGKKMEYKLMTITSKISGVRELRIVGDAGQGTQDLGFRATADILMNIENTRRK